MPTSRQILAHLYRRAAFGARPAELTKGLETSFSDHVSELVSGLSGPDKAGDAVHLPGLTPLGQATLPNYHYDDYSEMLRLSDWWIDRMIATDTPLREKLVLLLSNQFATSYAKVGYASLMYHQNRLFRQLGPGGFEKLCQAVATDPAMLIWLDADTDHKAAPNENFSRELMERFTIGAGNFTENDVRESAKAFTGWGLDYTTGSFFFNRFDHDNSEKRVLGHVGRWEGQDVIRIATHDARCSHWVVSRLWTWLAYPVKPNAEVVRQLAPAFARDLNITNLLEAILRHPLFSSEKAINGLIKQPIEYFVGTMRVLGLTSKAFHTGDLYWMLSQLGQAPFAPPNVGGWGDNDYWVSTSISNSQLNFAWTLSQYADLAPIADLDGNAAAQVDAVAHLLAIDHWSATSRAALIEVARDRSPQELFVLALVSPEYLVN